jgi:hypothetical protein
VRGQTDIMEYAVLVVMIMFVILFVVALIFGFQMIQTGSEKSKDIEAESLFVLRNMISSPIMNNPQYQKGSVLDDAKLTVMTCEDVEALFGEGVWVQVVSFFEKPDCDVPGMSPGEVYECTQSFDDIAAVENTECTGAGQNAYPQCGKWTFCEDNRAERMIYRSVPVNVYRRMTGVISLGALTVGIRGGGT